jgi:RHS repeat-associated protein
LVTVTTPTNAVLSFAYNLADWRIAETDPDGNQTAYSYSLTGELLSQTNPLNYSMTYSYNAAAEQTGVTDFNGQQRQFSYNEAGSRTGETWLNSNNQPIYQATYSYNNAGWLTNASDANSSYSYSYDGVGDVTQVQVTYPGLSASTLVTLAYGYDGFRNRASFSDGLGASLTYSYNSLNQLTGLSYSQTGMSRRAVITLSYDSQARLSNIGFGFPTSSYDAFLGTYSYDNANRLTGITWGDSSKHTTLLTFTYGLDAASQVTSYTGPEGTITYSYDKTGQLLTVSGAQPATYTFDANGNRTMSGYQTGTGNEILNDGTYTYTYDKNGNIIKKQDAQGDVFYITWDYRNRLIEEKEVNSSQQTVFDEKFTYDVSDHLIEVVLNGVIQRWTVFDGDNPFMDLNAAGQATERYVTNPQALDALFAKVSAGGTLDWYLTDRLGSIREIVGTTGTVLDQINYGAFGTIAFESNSSNGDRFKWDGGESDSTIQSYHFGARWYSSANGTWMSQDPLGLGPDSNPYRYAYNSPTNLTDPNGQFPFLAILIVGGIATVTGVGGLIYANSQYEHAQAEMSKPIWRQDPELIRALISRGLTVQRIAEPTAVAGGALVIIGAGGMLIAGPPTGLPPINMGGPPQFLPGSKIVVVPGPGGYVTIYRMFP